MGGFISVSGLGQSWVIFHRTILSHGGCRRRPPPRFLVLSRLWHADYFTCSCLGTNCKFFFVGNINFPMECKWSAIQNNNHLVKKAKAMISTLIFWHCRTTGILRWWWWWWRQRWCWWWFLSIPRHKVAPCESYCHTVRLTLPPCCCHLYSPQLQWIASAF